MITWPKPLCTLQWKTKPIINVLYFRKKRPHICLANNFKNLFSMRISWSLPILRQYSEYMLSNYQILSVPKNKYDGWLLSSKTISWKSVLRGWFWKHHLQIMCNPMNRPRKANGKPQGSVQLFGNVVWKISSLKKWSEVK